jgi:primosomal protein N' (replication factor Y)
MFKSGDIVCVLVPNAVNSGYDYQLTEPAGLGQFVRVSIMNRPYTGVIVGQGTSGLPIEKIKPVQYVYKGGIGLSKETLSWIFKMAEWTMMAPGAVLKLILNIPDAFSPPKTEAAYIMAQDGKIRMTEQRQAVADAFASNDNSPLTASDIQHIARVSPAVIRTMIKNKILIPAADKIIDIKSEILNYRDVGNIILNDEQAAAAATIKLNGFSVHLLDGITGSGKTQVYFDAAIHSYMAGKSVLLMMPEIALTAQFMSRFEKRFGAPPVVWHSNLSGAHRRDIWRRVATGKIRVVVGTRSALFLPWRNLGLIVVDEEHDGSYKQEDMGNYHARDMAILRAKIDGFPVVLASATPSMETMKNVAEGVYSCSKLISRFGGATLPKIELLDVRRKKNSECRVQSSDNHISAKLHAAIAETLNAGQQIMLFVNRRGFAPILQCKKCGWVAMCDECSIGMTYHKKVGCLLCHICGRTQELHAKCPECEAEELSMRGIGIEKIRDEVAAKFPDAKIAMVSSDTIASRQALERLVSQMESKEIDIIIGTQIMAKGHHFPDLTLVGVIDADQGLFGADFRAGEKTFQQLFQVAGRAGRGEVPGRVMLQTMQPEHPVLKSIAAGDRDGLMAQDMESRAAAGMPPYGQLIAVVIEAEKETILQDYCKALAAVAPKITGGLVMGPIPAQIYQIRTWFRMRFLVSGPARAKLQPIVIEWLSKVKQPANVRVKLDVNPQNFS